jgi:hypothetical protein
MSVAFEEAAGTHGAKLMSVETIAVKVSSV